MSIPRPVTADPTEPPHRHAAYPHIVDSFECTHEGSRIGSGGREYRQTAAVTMAARSRPAFASRQMSPRVRRVRSSDHLNVVAVKRPGAKMTGVLVLT